MMKYMKELLVNMIITITGKPCSGKDTIAKVFAEKYKFDIMSMGDIFRSYVKKLGVGSIGNLMEDERVKDIDNEVDSHIVEIGKTQLEDNLILVSRTAWFFIPRSFKVFLDVSLDVAASRLVADKRESEPVKNINEAKRVLTKRWNTENSRYQQLYNMDNNNLNNYDLVILTQIIKNF